MLQGRLFAYGDAHRYRLGINHTRLPVNTPKAVSGGASNYGRDGAMRFDTPSRSTKNYEPNSFKGPVQSDTPSYSGFSLSGVTGTTASPKHAEDDDFVQAGALYRTMGEDERERLVRRIGESLAAVPRAGIRERAIAHFRDADSEYGARVEKAVKEAL
jgi:catalase